MNKKDKSTKPGKGNADEMRFQCENWDEPTVRVNSKGKGCNPARKVVTNGLCCVDITDTLKLARLNLRRGREVRFTCDGEEAVRFIPVMEKGGERMFVCAQTMGAFRTETLADKKVRYTRRGEEVSAEAVKVFTETKKAEIRNSEETAVTPDTMVKCPKCGYRFRVGRRVAA